MLKQQIIKSFFTTPEIEHDILKNIKGVKGIDWKIQQFNYLYVIHRIIFHLTIRKFESGGCLINIQYLGKLFGKSNSETSTIIKNLIDWEIIYVSLPYKFKIKSRGYLINSKYSLLGIKLLSVNEDQIGFIKKLDLFEIGDDKDSFLLNSLNILKSSIKLNSYGYEFILRKYNVNLLPIDGGANVKYAISRSKKAFSEAINTSENWQGVTLIHPRDVGLFLIAAGDFYCVRPPDKNDLPSRVYNNLTNLPREYRAFISFNNCPLLMTDISNSQILLTVPLILKYWRIYSGKGAAGIPSDVLLFKELAEEGTFYEIMLEGITNGMPIKPHMRSLLKPEIFKELWFGPNKKRVLKVKEIFRNKFPNVLKVIHHYKEIESYEQFSIKLQQFESTIMVDAVAKKMVKSRKKILTLHDAIVTSKEKDLVEAEGRIKKAMAKHNILPKFKREENVNPEKILEELLLQPNIINVKSEKLFNGFSPLKKRTYEN